MLQYPVKEDFLHYLWRTGKLNLNDCRLVSGESLEILHYGNYNSDSGPDFFNGKIRIEDTIWAGNIEMHVFSSDWTNHRHHHDKAYDNVILHVVFEHDKDVYRADGSRIPTLELKGKIPLIYLENYLMLQQSAEQIPCAYAIDKVDKEKLNIWLYKLAIERLERKTASIKTLLHETAGNWDECMYRMLAKYMGTRVNGDAFELLAKSLPLSVILKNRNNLLIVEALLFGQAGMLEANYKDGYYLELQNEYRFQKTKFSLTAIPGVMWKFSKMRPANFPTMRIAQMASLLHCYGNMFDILINSEENKNVRKLLKTPVSDYWKSHYKFDSDSGKKQSGMISDEMAHLIIINVLAPILFTYSKSIGDERLTDKSVSWLESVPAEKNAIISNWKNLGISSDKAFESQALIQLRNEYCNQKRCLECSIGHQVLGM